MKQRAKAEVFIISTYLGILELKCGKNQERINIIHGLSITINVSFKHKSRLSNMMSNALPKQGVKRVLLYSCGVRGYITLVVIFCLKNT